MGQIGTIKLQTDSGTVDVPVFDTGDSGGSTSEALRVQTDSGIGFIPLVDPSDAARPYLRVQSQNNGVVAVHNKASLLTEPVAFSNLVAWYPFDSSDYASMTNNADDATGGLPAAGDSTAYDATVNGATFKENGGVKDINAGANSGAFNFSATDAEINVEDGDRFDFPNGDFTAMCWFKTTSSPDQVLIDKVGAYSSNNGWQLRTDANSDVQLEYYDTSNGNTQPNSSLIDADDGNYHHVAVSVDPPGGSFRLFTDGVEDLSGSFNGIVESTTSFRIGRMPGRSRDHQGDIDDVRIYDKALTATEIDNIFNNTQP